MPTQVIMPQFGESVVEGAVARWLIGEGQPVRRDEPLLQVTTDKVDTEIPAPASGVLLKIYVPEGQTVPKGTVLAVIGEQGSGVRDQESGVSSEPADKGQQAPPATPVAQRIAAEHNLDLAEVIGTGPGGRITREDVEAHLAAMGDAQDASRSTLHAPRPGLGFISPVVARLAGELGVDLTQVIGTGGGGRITKKDVLAYVAAPVPREGDAALSGILSGAGAMAAGEQINAGFPVEATEVVEALATPDSGGRPAVSAAGDYDVIPLSSMRRAIAEHMALSVRTAPHVTTVMEADMTRVVRARQRLAGEFERQGIRLTFTPFLVQAVVAGLKAIPRANSSFREDALLLYRRIHVGLAVALPDGLIVPVIRDADEKSLLGLVRAVNDLAGRSRAKQLKPEETQGGTFTLTNHGTSGSLFANPIIVQPQAGILGVGAIRKRPVVIGGEHPLLPDAQDAIAIRPMAYLSFTFDHRVLNGQEADGFLGAVKRFLEGYAA